MRTKLVVINRILSKLTDAAPKRITLWLPVALAAAGLAYTAASEASVPPSAELKRISKVVGGDTIKPADGTRVRLHSIRDGSFTLTVMRAASSNHHLLT